jgi:Zn-dependent protease
MLGWAKPTPVDPRNFKNLVWDDILTTLAGPASNFIVATSAAIVLAAIALIAPGGRPAVGSVLNGLIFSDSLLVPVSLFLYELMAINIVLGVFNLIPVPPLDGSHVLRHFLSENLRRAYDTMGIFGLIALVYLGGGLLRALILPVLDLYRSILLKV